MPYLPNVPAQIIISDMTTPSSNPALPARALTDACESYFTLLQPPKGGVLRVVSAPLYIGLLSLFSTTSSNYPLPASEIANLIHGIFISAILVGGTFGAGYIQSVNYSILRNGLIDIFPQLTTSTAVFAVNFSNVLDSYAHSAIAWGSGTGSNPPVIGNLI